MLQHGEFSLAEHPHTVLQVIAAKDLISDDLWLVIQAFLQGLYLQYTLLLVLVHILLQLLLEIIHLLDKLLLSQVELLDLSLNARQFEIAFLTVSYGLLVSFAL